MRKLLCTVVTFLLFTGTLLAQRKISGIVKDETGDPIPGATIQIKGTTSGTVASVDGSYSINIPASARVLVFSAIGMTVVEIAIGNQSVINPVLKPDDKGLAEFVVTGYAQQKRSQFTGAATNLQAAKTVENVPVGAFDQALQGRAPGLLVNSGSGQPGSSANVIIRGIQSIQGAGVQPLYIIDGVPLPAQDMQSINPNDFETITVLKDAAAAALYGARAGTGVIVITTKRGKAGTTNVTFRTQMGITQAPNANKFDLMNTSEILQYEERLKIANNPGWVHSPNNLFKTVGGAQVPKTPEDIAYSARFLDSLKKIDMDYSDFLYRQGFSQAHEINVSGGTDKTRFFFSGNMFDQKGTDLNSRLQRYAVRFNLDHTANNFSIQFNNSIGYSMLRFSEGELLGNSARNSFQMVWRSKPYENPYKPDGTLNYGPSNSMALKQVANVLEGISNSMWALNQLKINSGLTLSYKILPFLTVKNMLGIDMANDRYQRAINPASFVGQQATLNGQSGYNSEAFKVTTQIINTSSIVFDKKFGKHDVQAGGYFEVIRGYQKGLAFEVFNLDPRLKETGQGIGSMPVTAGQLNYPQTSSSAKSGYGIRSYFVDGRYTYNERYTITGNIRRDGTSRILNDANKEVTTWSTGFSWNAMEEDFLKSQGILTDLKFRVSYGAVPNIGSIATNNYTVPGALITVTNYLGPQLPSFGAVTSFAGSAISGIAPTTPGNPNLKIETIKKFNVGFDVAVWKSRARLFVDYYRNRTVDLFVRQPLPAESGFANLDINAGVMTNRGLELMLAVDVVKSDKVDLTLSANHAINKNNIEDLGLVDEYVLGTFVIRKGLPYGTHYTPHYLGADPQTGRPMFETLDGKVVYDAASAPQFAKFGTYLPKHIGGFNADFRFKRFSLSALFSYQFDVVRSNNVENWIMRGTAGYQGAVNGAKRLLTEQWQQPGDEKFYQSPSYDRGFSSSDLQDAKFLRFRSLNLSYQVPGFSVKGQKILKGARVYAQGLNLMIWSPWRGQDPEDNNNISLNEFPNPRMLVAGIDINF